MHSLVPRPQGSLLLKDIEIDLKFYLVYGFHSSVRNIYEGKVLSRPTQYKNIDDSKWLREAIQRAEKNNKKLNSVDSYLLEAPVFIVQTYGESDNYQSIIFASDRCLLEKRHNNNFMFSDRDLAEKYAENWYYR